MAVKIPIVTVFDDKGLKAAQYQLKKVDGNINALKRNFAIAGAAIAGAAVLIGKSLQDAAESQKVFAQTEAVLKSTGTTANGTARDIQNLASSLQKSTAFNDEAILSGQNLLLTFKNIQNQAGAGNDIFNQTSQAMLDVARAMGTDASTEAIRLGKALNDPVKGISALTRVGIQFTDQQKEQIKALAESGDLMGAQKIILAELQSQFGGSAAAYADTFAGQMESLNNELNDLSEEIGFMVMPAIQGLVSEFRDLIPIIGPQIKAAIEAVDWKGLVTTLVDLVTWFTENARVIGIVVGTVWALNTAYNLGRVAVGLYNAAAVILNTTLKTTTTSAKLLRGALLLTGVAAAVFHVGETYVQTKKKIEVVAPTLSTFNKEVYSTGKAAAQINPLIKAFYNLADAIMVAVGAKNKLDGKDGKPVLNPAQETGARNSALDSYLGFLGGRAGEGKQNEIDKQLADIFNQVGAAGSKASKAAKKAGKAAGEKLANGISEAKAAIEKALQDQVSQFASETPILDEWKEFGSLLGIKIAEGLKGAFETALRKGFGFDNIGAKEQLKNTYDKIAALQNKLIERTKFESQMKEGIMSLFDFSQVKAGINEIISTFRQQVEATKNFRNNLLELGKLGLSKDLLKQIAENKDFNTAAEIVAGGAAAVDELNSLYKELDKASSEIASATGNQLFNLGVDAATGYIRTLEDGFRDLDLFAKQQADMLSLLAQADKLQGLLSGRYVEGINPVNKRDLRGQLDAINQRLGMGYSNQYSNLQQQIEADYGYMSSGNKTGSASNVTININGGMSTSSEIGRAVVQAISSYERSSGTVFARA